MAGGLKFRGEIFINENCELEAAGDPLPSKAELQRRKSISARCGHVKRRLQQHKPLTGRILEFAIEVAGDDSDIGKKLNAGEALTEYEHHRMVDVYLLRTKLGAL